MASIEKQLSNMQGAVRDALGANWLLLLLQGTVAAVLGVVSVVWPFATAIPFAICVGWLFLVSGIVGLLTMLSSDDLPAFLWNFTTAGMSVAVGILLLTKPAEGALSLTAVLAVFFVVEGVFQIAGSIAYRDVVAGVWSWMLVSGIADLVLAAIIVFGQLATARWGLPLLVGINLFTSGSAIMKTALAAHNLEEASEAPAGFTRR